MSFLKNEVSHMKSLLPLLFFFTCLSCNTGDSAKGKEEVSQSPTVSTDSADKVIARQRALLDKVYELQEKNSDTTKQYIFFTCTVMDKSNQYIDLLSRIYTINKGDRKKSEAIKSCLIDIIKKNYFLNSDVIPVIREYATFKEANENRALYTSAQEIILSNSCK